MHHLARHITPMARPVGRAMLLALALFSTLVPADPALADDTTETVLEDRSSGSLWLEYGRNSTGGDDAYLEAAFDLAQNRREHRLTLGAGGTLGNGDGPDTTLFIAAFAHRIERPVFPELRYQFWGERQSFTTQTVSPSLTWYGHRGLLRLSPQVREITIYTTAPRASRPKITTSSYGLGADLVIYLGERWELSARGTRHLYADDPALLTTRAAAILLSSSGLDLSAGLLDWQLGWGGGYWFDRLHLTLEHTVSVYATDGSRAVDDILSATWQLSDRYAVGAIGGIVSGDGGGTGNFNGHYLRINGQIGW